MFRITKKVMAKKSLNIFGLNILQASVIIVFTLLLEYRSGLNEVGKFSYVQGILSPLFVFAFFKLRIQILRHNDPEYLLENSRIIILLASGALLILSFFWIRIEYLFLLVCFKIGEALWLISSAYLQKRDEVTKAIYFQFFLLILMTICVIILGKYALIILGMVMVLKAFFVLGGVTKYLVKEALGVIRNGLTLGFNSLLEILLVSLLRIFSLKMYGEVFAGVISIKLMFFMPLSLLTMSMGHVRLLSNSKIDRRAFYSISIAISVVLIALSIVNDDAIKYTPFLILKESSLKIALSIPFLVISSVVTYDLINNNQERLLMRSSLFSLAVLLVFLFDFELVRNNIVFITYTGFFTLRTIYLKSVLWLRR